MQVRNKFFRVCGLWIVKYPITEETRKRIGVNGVGWGKMGRRQKKEEGVAFISNHNFKKGSQHNFNK
jgi:hypothetical protein